MRLAWLVLGAMSAVWAFATYEVESHENCVWLVEYLEPPTHEFAWCQPLGIVELLGPILIAGTLGYIGFKWMQRRFQNSN